MQVDKALPTVDVEMFTLHIFSHFSNIVNMYNLKITCIMPHRGNDIKNVSLSPCDLCEWIQSHVTQVEIV